METHTHFSKFATLEPLLHSWLPLSNCHLGQGRPVVPRSAGTHRKAAGRRAGARPLIVRTFSAQVSTANLLLRLLARRVRLQTHLTKATQGGAHLFGRRRRQKCLAKVSGRKKWLGRGRKRLGRFSLPNKHSLAAESLKKTELEAAAFAGRPADSCGALAGSRVLLRRAPEALNQLMRLAARPAAKVARDLRASVAQLAQSWSAATGWPAIISIARRAVLLFLLLLLERIGAANWRLQSDRSFWEGGQLARPCAPLMDLAQI